MRSAGNELCAHSIEKCSSYDTNQLYQIKESPQEIEGFFIVGLDNVEINPVLVFLFFLLIDLIANH
jgi:hypothetical protein